SKHYLRRAIKRKYIIKTKVRKMTKRHQEFCKKAEALGYEVREYNGRNFHTGYGIVVDNVMDIIADLGMKGLMWDNMGLQFILYI
ncbi:MAG: hypothetical protein ACRCTJ_02705, partial [Brevinema sp.]